MTSPTTDSLEEVEGEVLVLFHFQDVPVPRNGLGKVDWYLSGAISRIALDGRFTGALGSAALFHPAGKLHAEKILVLGLGPQTKIDLPTLQAAAMRLRSLLDKLRAHDVRIVPPTLPAAPPQDVIDLLATTLRASGETSPDPPQIAFVVSEREHRTR